MFLVKDVVLSVLESKIRSFFAVFGIIFGTASVVLIVCAVKGSSLQASRVIKKLGTDAVLVISGSIAKGPRFALRRLDEEDVKLAEKIPGVKELSYGVMKLLQVSSPSYSKFSAVFGVSENWLTSWRYKLETGRNFTREDFKFLKKVAIVGHDVSDFLYPNENPIGKTILIGKVPFTIIGVYKRKGKTPNGHNLDNRVFVPFPVFDRVIDKTFGRITIFRFNVASGFDYYRVVGELKKQLLNRHSPDDFTIITPLVVRKFLSMLSASFALFLGLASAVSLVVGGFVLSAIFYINVKVRDWELALRRALGATKKDIVKRIILESFVISVVAGILGSALGYYTAGYLMPALNIPLVRPKFAFVVANIMAVVVCVISAYFPARRAGNVNPVIALRKKV